MNNNDENSHLQEKGKEVVGNNEQSPLPHREKHISRPLEGITGRTEGRKQQQVDQAMHEIASISPEQQVEEELAKRLKMLETPEAREMIRILGAENVSSGIVMAAIFVDVNPYTDEKMENRESCLEFARDLHKGRREIWPHRYIGVEQKQVPPKRYSGEGYADAELVLPNSHPLQKAELYEKYLKLKYDLTDIQLKTLLTAIDTDPDKPGEIDWFGVDKIVPKVVSLCKSKMLEEKPGRKKFGEYRDGRVVQVPDETGRMVEVQVYRYGQDDRDTVRIGFDRLEHEQVDIDKRLIDIYNTPSLIDIAQTIREYAQKPVEVVEAAMWSLLTAGGLHPRYEHGRVFWAMRPSTSALRINPGQEGPGGIVDNNKYAELYAALKKRGVKVITQEVLDELIPDKYRESGKKVVFQSELKDGFLPPEKPGTRGYQYNLKIPTIHVSMSGMTMIDHHRVLAASECEMPIEVSLTNNNDEYRAVR